MLNVSSSAIDEYAIIECDFLVATVAFRSGIPGSDGSPDVPIAALIASSLGVSPTYGTVNISFNFLFDSSVS